MAGQVTVVLMCGLPGSGKSTHAREYVARGYVRLSLDEVIWRRLGDRDPGRALDAASFAVLKEFVRRDQRGELVDLIRAGRDVVVDYTFWSRAAREDYAALIRECGAVRRLIYMRTDRHVLLQRLAAREEHEAVDSVTVSRVQLEEYFEKFEEPVGETKFIVDT